MFKKNLIFLAGELTKFLDFSQCDSITYHIFLLLLSKISLEYFIQKI